MAAAYRDSTSVVSSGATITVDPASPALTYSSGDVLILHVFGYGTIGAITGSDLTWTQILSDTIVGPFSNTDAHKVYWAIADASITSFTLSNGLTDQYGYMLMSIQGADTTTPIDGTPAISKFQNSGSPNQHPICPSISPAGSDSLLVCAAGFWRNGDVANAFTWTITEREDLESWDCYTMATETLSSSGATGTRTATNTTLAMQNLETYITSSVAVKSASSFGPPTGLTATAVSGSQIDLEWDSVATATGYDVERDGSQIVTNQPGTTYSDTGLAGATEYDYRVRSVKEDP